ncbi:jg12160 [Pararge aegeria aegeria]|uniref:Jg12160 protein n=1 Tax=Pararge aegeria aegeria TaxID=348720 RepID=A0A8S4RQL9_9NEOP|nr:jg12160 [Pararge aegeria aegeria]
MASYHPTYKAVPLSDLAFRYGVVLDHYHLLHHLPSGVTNSPLCRACMEADEIATHVMLRCIGVAENAKHTLVT